MIRIHTALGQGAQVKSNTRVGSILILGPVLMTAMFQISLPPSAKIWHLQFQSGTFNFVRYCHLLSYGRIYHLPDLVLPHQCRHYCVIRPVFQKVQSFNLKWITEVDN